MAKSADEANGAQAVKEKIDDSVIAEAESAGAVDVDEIVKSVSEKRADYQTSTQARFAQAAIEREIEASEGETVKGILMGSRDRFNKNWPRRYSLIRSNSEHLEISSWESTLPGPDGHDVDLSPGCIVSLGCEYNDEYDDYNAERVERISALDKPEMIEKLDSVATRPSGVSRSDEYEIVAVKGKIAYIDTQTLFSGGSPDGEGPVLMKDGHEPPTRQPHFEIALEDDDGARVRGHLERQNVGKPYVELPEIDMLLEDAMEAGGAEAQASFLQAALEGIEVTIIGNVNSVNTDRDDEGNKRTYVEIAATAVVDMSAAEATAESAATDDTENDSESEQTDAEQTPAESEGESSPATNEPAQTGVQADVAEVASDIETAANLQGADPATLTLADVKDMAPALGDEYPDEVITHAVESLSDDSDTDDSEQPEESESAAEGGTMSALEQCRDGGLYKCPADGCLAQVGEQGVFMEHIEDEHADGPAPEWVAEQVGA